MPSTRCTLTTQRISRAIAPGHRSPVRFLRSIPPRHTALRSFADPILQIGNEPFFHAALWNRAHAASDDRPLRPIALARICDAMHKQVSRSFSQALALRPESMATPPCHHGAAFTRFRPTLLAAALLAALWSAPTHAALNAVNYTVESDGTPGWDATDGPGLDTGPNNQWVRTKTQCLLHFLLHFFLQFQGLLGKCQLPRLL